MDYKLTIYVELQSTLNYNLSKDRDIAISLPSVSPPLPLPFQTSRTNQTTSTSTPKLAATNKTHNRIWCRDSEHLKPQERWYYCPSNASPRNYRTRASKADTECCVRLHPILNAHPKSTQVIYSDSPRCPRESKDGFPFDTMVGMWYRLAARSLPRDESQGLAEKTIGGAWGYFLAGEGPSHHGKMNGIGEKTLRLFMEFVGWDDGASHTLKL